MKMYISPAYEKEMLETVDVICSSTGVAVEVVEDPETGEAKTVATVSFSSLFGKSAN